MTQNQKQQAKTEEDLQQLLHSFLAMLEEHEGKELDEIQNNVFLTDKTLTLASGFDCHDVVGLLRTFPDTDGYEVSTIVDILLDVIEWKDIQKRLVKLKIAVLDVLVSLRRIDEDYQETYLYMYYETLYDLKKNTLYFHTDRMNLELSVTHLTPIPYFIPMRISTNDESTFKVNEYIYQKGFTLLVTPNPFCNLRVRSGFKNSMYVHFQARGHVKDLKVAIQHLESLSLYKHEEAALDILKPKLSLQDFKKHKLAGIKIDDYTGLATEFLLDYRTFLVTVTTYNNYLLTYVQDYLKCSNFIFKTFTEDNQGMNFISSKAHDPHNHSAYPIWNSRFYVTGTMPVVLDPTVGVKPLTYVGEVDIMFTSTLEVDGFRSVKLIYKVDGVVQDLPSYVEDLVKEDLNANVKFTRTTVKGEDQTDEEQD